MKKQLADAKKACLERLMTTGAKDVFAKALAVESHQTYTRYDLIHKAR